MSLAYVVGKLLAKMFIFKYAGGHLGFRHFGPFSRPIKNAIPFFLDLHDILSQNQVKNQF